MLTHIVVWKYRADVPQATRDEHVAQLAALGSLVPGVESLSVGPDTLFSPRSFDTGLVAVFADRAALDVYADHPEHVKVVEFGRSIAESMAKVDFEN